jgi:hypothetical protein
MLVKSAIGLRMLVKYAIGLSCEQCCACLHIHMCDDLLVTVLVFYVTDIAPCFVCC